MRLIVFLLLLGCFSGVYASVKAEIDTLHQRAYRLLNSNPDSAFALGVITEIKAAGAGLELEEAKSLFIQAYIYRQKEELGKAFVLYLKALELLRTLDDQKARHTYVKILVNTGAILEYHYAYAQAIKYYDEGISIAKEHGFMIELDLLYYNKSEGLRQLKQYDQALSIVNLALEVDTKESGEERVLTFLNQKGLILKDVGRYEKARASYQQIIDFNFSKVEPEEYRGRAWHNLAVTFVEEGRYEEAIEAYRQALYEKRVGDQKWLYITWMDLGETYYLMGRYDDAYQALTKAETLYDDMLLQPDHYAIFRLLSKTAYELGKHDESHAYSEQYMAVNKRFLEAQKEILQVKDQYKMEILTAGFFLEIEAAETERDYQMMLIFSIASAIFLLGLFGYEKVKLYNIRRSINRAIFDIEQKSSM